MYLKGGLGSLELTSSEENMDDYCHDLELKVFKTILS